ncbi:MAG: Na(+)-translocating NADH-quinone reductase subunit C [Hydrogenophilus thermoluteolus]|nr:Na(+)-translocating NADH-quinone reductase subunit C [Hydrogenophilus thermoluteolus]MBW7656046.1 Na(+)-translocating NADH-quinone reductase subunit C [Hydrogenophilus thermoluteolus]
MSNSETFNLKAIWALPNDDLRKIVAVALVVCFFCAALVSATVVALRPLQQHNQAAFRAKNIVEVAGIWQPGSPISPAEALKSLEQVWVELGTGRVLDTPPPLPADPQKIARDPNWSQPLARSEDPARIKRLPKVMPVYLKRDANGKVTVIVLPIHGSGLWSTMWGFLALEGDGTTIRGLKFYQQAETPGLGGEVENPKWRALWHGKRAFDEQGQVAIHVVKGRVDPNTPEAQFAVDGLAGATLTSKGVDQTVRFWLSERAYGPFLQSLRSKGDGQ